MDTLHHVCTYIYSINDPRSVQKRLCYAVEDFCRRYKFPIPSHDALSISRTETGKPYFPLSPQLQFSISHSGEYWSCALANQTVGYDLQKYEQPKNESPQEMNLRHQKMAARFFHPVETQFILLDCQHNFFTVWCAREAYVKHTGQGIDQYFSEHCVIPNNKDEMYRISGKTSEISWSSMGKFFWKTYYGDDYTICICTDTPCNYTLISLCDS